VRRVVLSALLFLCAGLLTAQQAPRRPLVIAAELDGIIHPVSAEYLKDVIDQADTSGADVVIITLRAACSTRPAISSRA
jgi:membrane-bound ClpP family serine protease